jgi:toxin ParE1/3/4
MSYRLIIKPLAENDIKECYAWYTRKQEGLGDNFLDEFERSLEFIERNPEQYQTKYKAVRTTKVNRYPICVHYTIEENTIFIHAVTSTSRDPQIWKERID